MSQLNSKTAALVLDYQDQTLMTVFEKNELVFHDTFQFLTSARPEL